MRTRFVNWLLMAVLFAAFGCRLWIAQYEFPLNVVMCAAGSIVAVEALSRLLTAAHGWGVVGLMERAETASAGSIPSGADRNPGGGTL